MFRKLFSIACMVVVLNTFSNRADACFTIVAGKNTTADGSVLVGHNEDNGLDNVAGMEKIPRKEHKPGEQVTLPGGGKILQVKTTLGYLILNLPECDYSNALLNECGVAIVSNNCHSREDKGEITDGGIGGPILRQLVAERARNAREGVKLVGSLVSRFGYTASGRTLSICDSNEGWLVAMVNGKHWAAERVPDNMVAVIANTYTIREMNLSDQGNYLFSKDLVDYAIKRKWYDPKAGRFSFEKAYANRSARKNKLNTFRQWSGMRHLSATPLPTPDKKRLPFAVKPKSPLKVQDLMKVLRDHYEGTPYASHEQSPHKAAISTICRPFTNASSIFQLRSGMPVGIGALWWCAMWQPCTTPYFPIYLGIEKVPVPFGFGAKKPGRDVPGFGPVYDTFSKLSRFVEKDYGKRIVKVKAAWHSFETKNFKDQESFERDVISSWKKNSAEAKKQLTRYCIRKVSALGF